MNRNNNGNRNNNRNNQNFQDDAKKSGAVYTKIRKGKLEGHLAVNAWRKTKNGLMKASAFPVDGVEHKGKQNGHFFMRYVVDIVNESAGTKQTFWCLMRMDTKKIVINELNLVISPNGQGYTSSGKRVTGFFGANYRRR